MLKLKKVVLDHDVIVGSVNKNKQYYTTGIDNRFLVLVSKNKDYYTVFDIYLEINGVWNLSDKADIHGYIKWDGCGNFDLTNSGTMTHFCSINDVFELSLVLQTLYSYCEENMVYWDQTTNINIDNKDILNSIINLNTSDREIDDLLKSIEDYKKGRIKDFQYCEVDPDLLEDEEEKMIDMGEKYLKINLGFINHDVIITRSMKTYNKLTKLEVPEDITGLNYLNDREGKSKQNIVYMSKDLKDLKLFYTSIHEATHVVDDIFDIFGFQDREVRAYLQEYISAFFYYDSESLINSTNTV